MKLLYALLPVLLCGMVAHGQISGTVVDENNSPLPGAGILLLPDSLHTHVDREGRFAFEGLEGSTYEIKTFFIGYQMDSMRVNLSDGPQTDLTIRLAPSQTVLKNVIVSGGRAEESTLSSENVNEEFFEKNLTGTFAQSIEKLPGISAINVGVGIAKPVIRGLYANRIIVNHYGVKQESQQWGSDHGLEIDQFDVERLEIIKGPASLQYGSDGLGGVINILPDKILPKNGFSGSVSGVHKTNNEHWGGSAKLAVNVNDFFVSGRYSEQRFGDYNVPAELFTYNGFDLPILNNRLRNTAGRESNMSLNAGVNKKAGITRVHYSHYQLEAGLFSGAVGVPRAYALTDDGNSRDIDAPKQEVDHQRLSLNQSFYLGAHELRFDFGYQRNHRKEFSVAEFHNIPLSQLEDPNDQLALELILETFSGSAEYEHQFSSDVKGVFGVNAQRQENQRGGFAYLLPDFTTFRAGLFSILEKQVRSDWLVNGGLRLDFGHNETDFFRQYIWDSNENIIDSLISVATDDRFFNWSASIGSSWTLQDGKYMIKANLGKSFRVPYPSETVSNGIHHGTFRHEVGTPTLSSEQGYQVDVGVTGVFKKIEGSLSVYFNYFDDYIYLGPTFPARFSNLPEAGQIFQYRQDDAIYTGFELEWHWEILRNIEFDQAIDFVQSYNPETQLALPFTPQPSIKNAISYTPFKNIEWVQDTYLEVAHKYHLAAEGRWRIDRSEQPTPAFQLWDIGIGSTLKIGQQQEVRISCQVQNLFNTRYLAHLSRYRLINVPEQGRNVVVNVKIPFTGSL